MSSQVSSLTNWDKLSKRALSSANSYRVPNDRCSAALCVCRGLVKGNMPDVERISSKLKVIALNVFIVALLIQLLDMLDL